MSDTVKKKRKKITVLQGYYCKECGWEDICEYDTDCRLAKKDLQAYEDNAPEYRYRLVGRYIYEN